MSNLMEEYEEIFEVVREAARGGNELQIQIAREETLRQLKGKLHSPARVVDAVIEEYRPRNSERGDKEFLSLNDMEPWPEEVRGTELLAELEAAFGRYLVFPPGADTALALWVVHCHTLESFQISPRLAVTSPIKGCGKTTLLDVLEPLVPRPLIAASLSASVAFRTIEKYSPTLLIDEADTFLNTNEELRGILNAGHRRGGQVLRNVAVGDDYEPRPFAVFSAVAIAKIGHLPETLADRSIHVQMRRRAPDEIIENFRRDRTSDLSVLAQKAARWAKDHQEELQEIDPEMPEGVFNRQADNWRPLLAIADVVGGEWPERARRVIGLFSSTDSDEDSSALVQLLSDIKAVYESRACERLFSETIVEDLVVMEDKPWPEWRKGRPLSATQLARLLRKFKVKPKQIRIDGQTKKGYELTWFEDAFTRYLPTKPKQPKQLNDDGASLGITNRNTGGECFALESGESSIDSSIVSGVSFPEGGVGQETPEEWGEL